MKCKRKINVKYKCKVLFLENLETDNTKDFLMTKEESKKLSIIELENKKFGVINNNLNNSVKNFDEEILKDSLSYEKIKKIIDQLD